MQASVPSANSSAKLYRSGNPQFESSTQAHSALAMTAASAGISFYEEFYPVTAGRREQPKTGMLHWVGSMIKKAARK